MNTDRIKLIDPVKAQLINMPLIPMHFNKPFSIGTIDFPAGYYAVFVNQFADCFVVTGSGNPTFENLSKCQVSCIVYDLKFCGLDRLQINNLFSLWNTPILQPSLYENALKLIGEKDAVDIANA